MISPGRAATTAALMGVSVGALGCGLTREPTPRLTEASPAVAYNDAAQELTIVGESLRPAYNVDTSSGDALKVSGGFMVTLVPIPSDAGGSPRPARVSATGISWIDEKKLKAYLPPGVPAGTYDVEVRDPRGWISRVPNPYTSLGPDVDAPTVDILAPPENYIAGAGALVEVKIRADDGFGLLTELRGGLAGTDLTTCAVAPEAPTATCTITFVAPTPVTDLDAATIRVEAMDHRQNIGWKERAISFAPRPTVTGIQPQNGPAAGGTFLTVQGTGFVPSNGGGIGTQIVLGGRPLSDSLFLDSTIVTVFSPPHDPGRVPVAVQTGGAVVDAGSFLFVGAPLVRVAFPKSGPTAGGTVVSLLGNNFREETVVSVADVPLCRLRWSATRIDVVMPAGAAPGPVALTAWDPIGGQGVLESAFTYVDDLPPAPAVDGGCAPAAGDAP